LTVIAFNHARAALVAVTFPLTVMGACVRREDARMSRRDADSVALEVVRLAAQTDVRARGGSDVVSDGDRRQRALRVEHAPASTFRFPTADHGTGRYGARAGGRDARVCI